MGRSDRKMVRFWVREMIYHRKSSISGKMSLGVPATGLLVVSS